MVLAAIDDGIYNLTLFLHILAVLVAFAPAFVHPVLTAQVGRAAGTSSPVLAAMHRNGRRIYAPALIVAGLLGFALQGFSDGVWSLGQTWLWLSIVLWVAMNGILHAVLLPAERSMSEGDTSAEGKLGAAGAAVTVLLLVVLALMVFKPGA